MEISNQSSQSEDKPSLVGLKRRREELELLKMEHEVKTLAQTRLMSLTTEYEKMCTNTNMDEHAKAVFKAKYLELLDTIPSHVIRTDTGSQSPTPVMFLAHLADASPNDIMVQARDLYNRYMDYCTKTGAEEQLMTTGRACGLEMKTIPGISEKGADVARFHKLDHAAIQSPVIRTDAGSQPPTLAMFLAHLADASPNDTMVRARELHKRYIDYCTNTGGKEQYMLTETAFALEMKMIPGVSKKRTEVARFYKLDHAAIQQSETIPSPVMLQPAPTPAMFLAHLADASPNDTMVRARELHKRYMDYCTKTGGKEQLVMTETAFGREIKTIPGIFQKRTDVARFYMLDHAAIKQSGTIPSAVISTGADVKTGLPTLTMFLAHLTDVSPNDTKFRARDLYKRYVEYYASTGNKEPYMITETAFCRELKKIPGVLFKRTDVARFYTLDHAAIQAVGHGNDV
jgi:hypothetical protein